MSIQLQFTLGNTVVHYVSGIKHCKYNPLPSLKNCFSPSYILFFYFPCISLFYSFVCSSHLCILSYMHVPYGAFFINKEFEFEYINQKWNQVFEILSYYTYKPPWKYPINIFLKIIETPNSLYFYSWLHIRVISTHIIKDHTYIGLICVKISILLLTIYSHITSKDSGSNVFYLLLLPIRFNDFYLLHTIIY